MIFKLTAKNCQIPTASLRHLDAHLRKVTKFLPHIQKDLIVLRLFIRKNIDRYHPSRIHPHQNKSYADTKPELALFEGSMAFRLSKKRLYVHFKGKTIDECSNLGFDRIYKEIRRFKDLHFPAESKYPDHSTIRKLQLI